MELITNDPEVRGDKGTGVLTPQKQCDMLVVEVMGMPRTARKKSQSGIYHIMIRGINRQDIFEDNEDKEKFIQTIAVYKDKCNFQVYGYCLMNNHIHLLINDENLAISMRKICASYVYWYNWKYKRCGHLYQDRFKSEAIEDDGYLLTVLRYIHQNPLKAGMVKNIADYNWSSYGEYLDKQKIVDVGLILEMLPREQFIDYNNEENQDRCLEYVENYRLDDNEAREIIKKIAKVKNINEIQGFEKVKRDDIIRKLKEIDGLSIRQIERITGITRKIIEIA